MFTVIIAVLLLGLSAGASAQVIEPALEQRIATSRADELLPVIVVLSSRADLKAAARLGMTKEERRAQVLKLLRDQTVGTQGSLISQMRKLGATHFKRLWIINGVAARVPANAVDDLAALPGVKSVRLDGSMNAPTLEPGTAVTPEWNIDAIQAPELWKLGYLGQGIVVASLDTGVDVEHPDLTAKWRGGANSWFDPYDATTSPFDVDGHGTQVMGLIVGGDAGGTAIGVAPAATWIAAKIFGNGGVAEFSNVHLAFQWALDPDGNSLTSDAPDIVNASFGFNVTNECNMEFEPDIAALKAAGIGVVVAAGNSGPLPATSISPGNYPESFAVGSVDSGNAVSDFSSRGPSACDGTIYPELVAPGVNVDTADLSFGGIPFYITVSGTSFTAPHVSGAMALLLSASPDRTPAELELALEQSALDVGAFGPDNDTGYGALDVLEAFKRLGGAAPTDADADGYVAGVDCNDNNSAIYPGAIEVKYDGVDQD
ncbi:MAG: S8 family serine peptidase, partial [Hypericibacter sp.]